MPNPVAYNLLDHLPPGWRTRLTTVVAQATHLGVRLWLVGGVVRDLLSLTPLGSDLDLAVEGDLPTLAQLIATAMGGRIIATYAPFGTATIELPSQAEEPPLLIDLAHARVEYYTHPAALPTVSPATISADLARRDFSVNAMACELTIVDGTLHAGPILDPCNGQADLAAAQLRLLHPTSLRDDPTRILRGLRLAARLNLTLTPDTQAQLADALAHGYLHLPAPERLLAEICLALREPRPDVVLRLADTWGVTSQLLPGLTWSSVLEARSTRLIREPNRATPPELLWAGLLLYDLAAADLERFIGRYPLPGSFSTLLRQLPPLRTLVPTLALLSTSALDQTLSPFSVAACSVVLYAQPEVARYIDHYLRHVRPTRPPLDGHDLIRLGIPPGPLLGRLRDELRAAALDGQISDRAAAEQWVRRRQNSIHPSSTKELAMDETLQMLKDLAEAPGVPGQEGAVRQVMRRYLEPLGEVLTDNLGSIIGHKAGVEGGPRIMIAGHLDEIGFMVTRITDDGYLKFQTLGGWWEQVMLAQRVEIYTRQGPLVGVIGSKPPHILNPEERKKIVEKKAMFIDIGAASRAEAESWGVRPGDPVVPVGPFAQMRNPDLLMAKAWDNRFGCALAIETLRRLQNQPHPNSVYAVGTVQEEVGLRGATTTTNVIQPDIGIALDTGIAGDTPGISPDEASGKLGGGPTLLLYDGSMIAHTGLRDLVFEVAAAAQIPLQLDAMAGGGTDGGRIHIFGAGVPSVVIGIPVRYIHTHTAIMHRRDFDQAAQLMVALVQRLDAATVARLKS